MNPFFVALGIGSAALIASRPAAFTATFGLGDFPMIDYGNPNLAAFLATIREGESSDNYFALAGGGQFSNTTDHPALTGEFAGIPVGGGLRSYASGAYQITRDTWLDLGGRTRYGSFDAQAQDRAAADLIAKRGALDAVLAGRVAEARAILTPTWEIFAKNWDDARTINAFLNYGGILAS